VGHRFLHKDVFSQRHRGHGDREVHVIGRGNGHRVDRVAQLIEKFAEVAKSRHVWKLFEVFRGAHVVDIAERHEVFAFHGAYGGIAPSAHSDARDVQLVVRGLSLLAAHDVRERGHGGAHRGGLQERATGNDGVHGEGEAHRQ
jgi:hypothetical protein